jgi:hypothetical protein
MKEIKDAIGNVLRADSALISIMGLDTLGFPRIYGSPTERPKETQPPFVYYQIIPGREPLGTYRNNEELDGADFQVTAWGRTTDEVWRIQDLLLTTIRGGDWATYLIPLVFMRLKRQESPGELPDRDTNWRQIPTRWRLDTDVAGG